MLRPLEAGDAPAALRLIESNREHLDRWLRWSSALQSLVEVETLIVRAQARLSAGDGFHLGLWVEGGLAGGVVCWYIQREHRGAELGYWLGKAAVGRGLATRATARVVRHLFEAEALNRIELQCGVGNLPSRKVAERLGFRFEGIRRESHWITSRFVDHAVYGLLQTEWRATA